MTRAKRKEIDWQAVKKVYESGKSGKATAEMFGVDPSLINRKARADGWAGHGEKSRPQPPNPKRVNKKKPLEQVSEAVQEALVKKIGEVVVTDAAIQEAALTIVQVINTHRAIAQAGRALAFRLVRQLDADSERRAELENMIMEDFAGEDSTLKRDRFMAAVSLGGHAETLKTISVAAANFIKIEREAFNIGDVLPTDGNRIPLDSVPPEEAQEAYRRMVG